MRKGIAGAQHHPTNRSIEDFRAYWRDAHGPMGANLTGLRRYVQHITLPEAYVGEPMPNLDGVSMFWFDGDGIGAGPSASPMAAEIQRAVQDDDIQLFDRTLSWPTHRKQASVTSDEEHIVIDAPAEPDMVKALFIVAKMPGLTLNEFFAHWGNEHAALTQEVPGLRRYIQNPAALSAYSSGGMTHDGFAELWFDDLASLRKAARSRQWAAVKADGETLFGPNMGVAVVKEQVQKEFDWKYYDWGVSELDESAIRERLRADGYTKLADDPDAPAQIKKAASNGALAIWNELHLVTIDESRIDVRPGD